MGAGAAWIALANALGCESAERKVQQAQQARAGPLPSVQSTRDVQTFRSRPDLDPPAVDVSTQAHGTASGHIFVAPKKGSGHDGPMILDDRGEAVWFRPTPGKRATDFKVQYYGGEPVLTWWEGKVVRGWESKGARGHGVGEYVILDSFYREITRVRAGNGYRGDLHEFLVTPQDTALLTAYGSVRADFSSIGGPEEGAVLEGIAQEVDIETGEVLFEWHSLEHVGLDEAYVKPPRDTEKPFDYFHINSIDLDHDGNLLISARQTSTVYKINRETGEIMWRLGGKKSTFDMDQGARTVFQHDARRQPDGAITIFDNGGARKGYSQSRGIALKLDENQMSATLVREYTHPDKRLAGTQGNVQVLPSGDVFVGWGSEPAFSEFGSEGELLFDASFLSKNDSYRAFRFPWSARPSDQPAVAVEPGPDNEMTLYASWNGATEVASWQVLSGPTPERLEPVGAAVPREGFETAITVDISEAYVGVQARERSGRVLGILGAVKLRARN